ncbi:sigma-70 family RNA polymerase sigma factor [Pseudonocardia pini]|uniref:sigma-70 family RNA polymerase sigma factor n=1 Tax=Pseudonocardia pini TaxID=2758030 RepID=UPI0015F059D2|nr:sigma-70 family RNA polymerase sigma factor [Pseudonocardia pini]
MLPVPNPTRTAAAQDLARIDRLGRAAAAGDRAACEELMAALHPPVLRYCRSRLATGAGDATSAEDMAQDTLIALLKALPTFDHNGGPLLAFAFTIARNKIIDTVRRSRISRIDLTDTVPDSLQTGDAPDELTVQAEQAAMVQRLLGRLPERHRDVLRLRLIEGRSAIETAALLGSTPGSVRVTQHRALTALRRYLADRPVPREQMALAG